MYMHPINKHFGSLFGFVRDIAQGRMGASTKNMVDCFMMSQHKGADSVGRLAQQKELWGREPARDVSQIFHSTEGGENKRITNRKEDFAVGVRPV